MTTQGQFFRAAWSLLAAFFIASAMEPGWVAAQADTLQSIASWVHSGPMFGAPRPAFFWGMATFSGLMALGYI